MSLEVGVWREFQPWRPKPPEFGGEEFLRRKASAGQVSGVFLGPDESPMRGREELCDVFHYLTRQNSLRWAPGSERQGK